MAAFTGGDGISIQAIVADIGSHSTKIGWAGDDYPRSYFRSNVAVLRDGANDKEPEAMDVDGGDEEVATSTTITSKFRRRRRTPIVKVHYDSYSKALNGGADDGNWETSCPVDHSTGLMMDRDWWTNPTFGQNEVDGKKDEKSKRKSQNSNEDQNGLEDATGSDWSDMVSLFLRHGYSSALGLGSASQNPLLFVERSYNPPPLRQQLLEVLMEDLQVPAAFLGRDATMSCYSCGRTTGTVVDMGYSGTVVTPVHEGYVEQKGIRRCPVGSLAMDEFLLTKLDEIVKSNTTRSKKSARYQQTEPVLPLYMIKQLRQHRKENGNKTDTSFVYRRRRESFHRLARLAIAMDCRESGAGASVTSAASKSLHVPSMSYELPDGQVVSIPSPSRFQVAELILGRPQPSAAPDGAEIKLDPDLESTQKIRDEWATRTRSEYAELMEMIAYTKEQMGERKSKDGDSSSVLHPQQQGKFSDAAAVGISQRQSTRGAAAGDKASKKVAASISGRDGVMFPNTLLQQACLPYLQTQAQQFTTSSSVAAMVCDAAFLCDREQQTSLLGNVVLGGGGACIGPTDQAVPDLLREQVESIIHTHTPGWKVKVMSPGIKERAYCSWLGGSILGSLGSFHELWITKAEYDEWGSAIVNRKCP